MPRPCPHCQRPVADARKTCLYCGAVAPLGEVEGSAPGLIREPLDSSQAVVRLLEAAHKSFARGEARDVAQAMARLFLELHPTDLGQLLATMTEGWLRGMVVLAGPARLGRASLCCQQAAEAALQQRWQEAALQFSEARVVYAYLPKVNPTMEMLALGANQAFAQADQVQQREARLEALILDASRLLAAPGRKAESMPLFRQALAVLGEDPDRPQNRERSERIGKLIADFEQSRDPEPQGPASLLPPRTSLPPDGWDDLGMQLLPQHPQQAKVCFERAAVGQPENGQYWLHLAMCLTTVEAPDSDIISAFGQAVMRDPGELKAWIGLASALQEAARFGEAVAAWGEALKLAPGGDAPARQRDFCQKAERLVAAGCDWDARAWLAEGSRCYDQQEWNLAEFAFSRALDLAPEYPGALMGKGIANFQWAQGLKEEGNPAALLRFRMAAEVLAQALALRPEQTQLIEIITECQTEVEALRGA